MKTFCVRNVNFWNKLVYNCAIRTKSSKDSKENFMIIINWNL